MPLPLISLLALGVGASAGAAELSDERRALLAKQEEDKRAAAAELAKVKAEGVAKAEEAAAKEKAKILAQSEAKILEAREAETQRRRKFTEFTELYSTGNVPGITAAQATGFEGWDEGALATFRIPYFDEEGEQLVNDKGKPLFRPLQVRDSSQTGVAGATAEFQALTGSDGMSRRALEWTRNNSLDDYNSFKTTLATTVRAMATKTPAITGETASVPVILPSTVRFLADKYGVDFSFGVIQDALVGTDQAGTDSLKQQYAEVFGVYPATNAKAKVNQVKTPEGETALTPSFPDGGGWLKGFDKPDGTLFENGRVVLKQAAEAVDVSMPKFEQFLVTEAEFRSDTLDREVLPGEIAYDIFTIRDSLSGYNLYNAKGAGAFFNIKTQANTFDRTTVEDFIAKYGLFAPGGDYNADLALFQAIAPIGVKSYYPRQDGKNTKSLLEGGQPSGAEIKSTEFYAQPNEQYDDYINKKYGRVLGEDLQSFRNKGLAAGDAVLTLDSLIALDEQTQIPVPIGIAATGLKWIASARDQIDSILEVVDVVGLSEDNKAFVRDKLGKTRAELESDRYQGMTTQDVVNAISLRDFHEGVLVYSMAMALQGGNAAARTISDADITRIREILSLSAGATREQRKTIYTALRNMMKRQKAISDAAVGGGEAGVWAAATMSEFSDRVAIVRNELNSVLKLARRTVGKRVPDRGNPSPAVEPGSPVPNMPGFIYDDNGNAVPA